MKWGFLNIRYNFSFLSVISFFVVVFRKQYPWLEVLGKSGGNIVTDNSRYCKEELFDEICKREIPSCSNEFSKDDIVWGSEEIADDLFEIGFEDTCVSDESDVKDDKADANSR